MYGLTLAFFPLLASAAPQLGDLLGGIGGDPMVPEKVEEVPAEYFPDAKRTITRWGPYQMAGKDEPKPDGSMPSMDESGQSFMSRWKEGICHDCSVLGGYITLQLEDGSDALTEDVYIHHILSFNTDKKTEEFVSYCPTPDGQASEGGGLSGLLDGVTGGLSITPFLGFGEDNSDAYKFYTAQDGSFESGFHIGAEDEFMAQIDLVNYNAEPRDVYITLDMEWQEGTAGKDAYSTLLQVQGCSMKPIETDPNGPANTTSEKFPILTDGNIVSARGHLHAGGVSMVLFHNDQEICVSEAVYEGSLDVSGEESSIISGMSDCNDATPVKAGDYISMTAIYDLAAHPAVGGGHSHGGGGEGGEEGGHDMAGMGGMGGEGEEGGGMGGMGGEMGMWSIIFAPAEGPAPEEPASESGGVLSSLFGR